MIGGYFGTSYEVRRTGEVVMYRHRSHGDENWTEEAISIPPERWRAFRRELDGLSVWSWKKNYKPRVDCCDGESWSFSAVYTDRRVQTSGSNAYPDYDDPLESDDRTELFESFCSAISRLIGGRAFN